MDLDIPLLADSRSFDVVMVMRFMLFFFLVSKYGSEFICGQFFSVQLPPVSSRCRHTACMIETVYASQFSSLVLMQI